jgi:serine/threonine-protein kinase ATR
MKSIVSASRQRNGANTTANGSQPLPSSLIAAHLAPTDESTFSSFDREDFALLLKESLGSDEDGQPNLGTDVTLNHKLICVIVKAGLDTINLRSDDPFRKDNDYHDQIRGCIEVIDLVVERTPEALFVPSKSEDLGPRALNVPMFVWVIPKLLSLLVLDKPDTTAIAELVWPLLSKMLASAKQCPNSFDLCISISTYVEELSEGDMLQWL